ncbi:MAG: ParM/StbA family protein [Anaerolineae bacterium]|nr:ParM/StbA family protein [Anaerolineae bacterium]
MIRIGLDPGFGNFKIAAVSQTSQVALVPSVVGVGETDLGLLSLGRLGRRRHQQPDQVTFGGVSYLVGENVARFARPVQRLDFLRLSDGPELRALFYDAVFRLLGRGSHLAALIIGLPVEVMADRQQALDTLRSLKAWMVGQHYFTVNNSPVVLEVTQVRVMAQPSGAFFAWGLDNSGHWSRPKADLKAPVAVCDIGFNTLDLFAVQGGEVVGRFTGGDTAGMRRAAELLINAVQGRHGVDLSLHEADALLRRKRPTLYTPQGEADLRPFVTQALDTTAAGVLHFVERHWGNGRQFAHLLFTGGGAETLREALLRQYPHGVVLPEPVTANALGLARYAQRVFKADG